jgi:hypothetical protein
MQQKVASQAEALEISMKLEKNPCRRTHPRYESNPESVNQFVFTGQRYEEI